MPTWSGTSVRRGIDRRESCTSAAERSSAGVEAPASGPTTTRTVSVQCWTSGPARRRAWLFGYGAAFPQRYQEALYLLDWSQGKIHALHLTPRGSTYSGTLEPFVTGQPLPVTDAVIHPVDSAPVLRDRREGRPSPRSTGFAMSGPSRRTDVLQETLHERCTQCAPRIATQSGDTPRARSGPRGRRPRPPLPRTRGSRNPVRSSGRAGAPTSLEMAFERSSGGGGRCKNPGRPRARARGYARRSRRDAHRAARHDARGAVDATTPRLATSHRALAEPLRTPRPGRRARARRAPRRALPRRQLRRGPSPRPSSSSSSRPRARSGRRSRSFGAHRPRRSSCTTGTFSGTSRTAGPSSSAPSTSLGSRRRAASTGGMAIDHFVELIEDDAREHLSFADRLRYARPAPPEESDPGDRSVIRPEGPGRSWTLAEIAPLLERPLRQRSHERGEAMFVAGGCFSCHRFAGRGGATGPDLTSVGSRFGPLEIAESVVEPSRVVSEPVPDGRGDAHGRRGARWADRQRNWAICWASGSRASSSIPTWRPTRSVGSLPATSRRSSPRPSP